MTSATPREGQNALNVMEKLNDDNNFHTNWMVVQFNKKDEIVLVGSGEGGYSEGRALLKDEIMFLIVRGCHKRMKIIQKIIMLLLYIPENVIGFNRAKSAFQVDILSSRLKIGHFCLLDTRKDPNLEIEAVTERIKIIIGSPGKYIVDETSNKVLQGHHDEQEKKKERPQSEKNKQTENNVFKEILETEETYVRSLNLFVSAYINPLKEIVPDFYRSLFTLINIILNINEEFLKKLQQTKGFSDTIPVDEKKPLAVDLRSRTPAQPKEPPKPTIIPGKPTIIPGKPSTKSSQEESEGESAETEEEDNSKKNVALMVDILVSQCPVFKLYLPYVNEYTRLLAKVNLMMQKDSKFRDFCNRKKMELQKQKERCTDIYGFLIMPIQRIPRYQLLMRDLLKQTHPKDPNYPKISEGLDKTLQLAQYVNEKKAESVMSVKTISISQKYKMNDLMDLKRKMVKYNEDCTIKKDEAQICVFTDILLLIKGYRKKKKPKVDRISLTDPDVRVYISNKETDIVLETQRKKHVVGFKNKVVAESFIDLIQTTLSVNLGQAAMDQKLMSHIIFQSMLLKDGGGRYSHHRKKRWHELTADMKMKYYDKKLGKMKGSYSIIDASFGKGTFKPPKPSKQGKQGKQGKKGGEDSPGSPREGVTGMGSSHKYDFFIRTVKRTYQMYAGNVEILDIWVRVLALVGLKREDKIDEEVEKAHQNEFAQMLESKKRSRELAELRERQAAEEALEEKRKQENFRKMFLKLNSKIKNMPDEEEEEEEEAGEEEGEEEEEGESENEGEEQQEEEEIEKSEEVSTVVSTKNSEDSLLKTTLTKTIEEPSQQQKQQPKQEAEVTTTTPQEQQNQEEEGKGEEDEVVDLQILTPGTEKTSDEIFKPLKQPRRRRKESLNVEAKEAVEEGREKLVLVGRPKGGMARKKMKFRPVPPKSRPRSGRKPPAPPSGVKKEALEDPEKKKNPEDDVLFQQRLEMARRKNLMHTELKVRRKSIIQSQKLIEKIRAKKISVKSQDDTSVEEEKDENTEKQEIEEKEDLAITEKVIEKKRNVHQELIMKKKGLQSVPLFRKMGFGRKKKNAGSSEDLEALGKKMEDEEKPSKNPVQVVEEVEDPKKKKKKGGLFGKIPVWRAKKNMQKELMDSKKKPKKPPSRPSKGARPVTVAGSLRGRLEGLDEIKAVISKDDEKRGKEAPVIPRRRQGRPAPKPVAKEPWRNKQKVNKELLFMRKMMTKTETPASTSTTTTTTTPLNPEIEEIIKKERMKWEKEFEERLEKALEEKKLLWREQFKEEIREEVLKELKN